MTEDVTLLDRHDALERIREALRSVVTSAGVPEPSEGRGQALVLAGPAGIGKTSVLDAASRLANELGIRCLRAVAAEVEQEFAFGVVRQLFEAPLRTLPRGERDVVLSGPAAFAATLFDSAAPPPERDAPRAESPFAATHGLYWFCTNLAHQQPLLVAVDDLQWCDEPSARFVDYLARRLGNLPIVVVIATRTADAAAPPPRDSILATATRITLAPLGVSAVERLVEHAFDRSPAPAFVAACHAATGGNPFLLSVLLGALRSSGTEPDASAASRVPDLASGEIAARIVARLGALSPEAARLARAAAVLSRDVELRVVAALAHLPPPDASRAADALVTSGILRMRSGVDFVHPLVRSAIATCIPPGERARLHGEAARLLSEEGAPADRVAAHLLAAEPFANGWVVDTLCAAADSVIDRGEPRAATTYLRRAMREPPPAEARPTILRQLGIAEIQCGDLDAAVVDLERARDGAAEKSLRVQAANDLGRALRACGRYPEAARVYETTLAELGDGAGETVSGVLAEVHQTALMTPLVYRDVSRRFDAVLGREADATSPARRALLAALATESSLRCESAEQTREYARAALDNGCITDRTAASAIWVNAAFPAVFSDDFATAARAATAALENARSCGSPVGAAYAHTFAAYLHLAEGRVRDAEADARVATELRRTAGIRAPVLAIGVLVEALVERDAFASARAVLREHDLDGELPELFLENFVLYSRARLHSAESNTEAAIADLEELARRGEHGWRPWNPGMFPYRSLLAQARASNGERATAKALANEELALARHCAGARTTGIALRALGLVTAGARGLDHLRESVDVLEGTPARLELARSHVELGAALRRAGKRVDARSALERGMDLAHSLGAQLVTRQAREELRAAGARPRRYAIAGVDSLTPSELRVAQMAASGMTNPEIAQALFVIVRTVETHLTHAYEKLGIRSRDELAPALARSATSES